MSPIGVDTFAAARALLHPGSAEFGHHVAIRVERGRIAAVTESTAPVAQDLLMLHPLVDAHRTMQGCWPRRREPSAQIDPYLAAAIGFGRLALSGFGTIVFAPECGVSLPELRAVAAAGRDLGIRLVLAYPFGNAGGEAAIAPWRSVDQAAALCTEFGIGFQLALARPDDLPEETLRRAAEFSAAVDCRVQMVLSQGERHGASSSAIERLDQMGLLSPKLTLINPPLVAEEDFRRLQRQGVITVIDVLAQMRRDYKTYPLAELLRAGASVAFGFDGPAFDHDGDFLRDLRLAYLLTTHAQNEMPLDRAQFFDVVHAKAFFAATGETSYGMIVPGAPADFLFLDWRRLGPDVLEGMATEEEVFLTRASAGQVAQLVVAGKDVVQNGALVAMDLASLEAGLRAEAPSPGPSAE